MHLHNKHLGIHLFSPDLHYSLLTALGTSPQHVETVIALTSRDLLQLTVMKICCWSVSTYFLCSPWCIPQSHRHWTGTAWPSSSLQTSTPDSILF